MPRSGPRKIHKYSDEFKLTAVRLSQQPGIQVQTVATALEIHPFMLSKWRKDVKEGACAAELRRPRRPGRRARLHNCNDSSGSTPNSRRSTIS
jgi:transposase